MEGQILLNILLDNGFKETTMNFYSSRYHEDELTETYRDFQHRDFEKNNFVVSFAHMNIEISCNTGMNGFEPKFTLKQMSMEHVAMILLLSKLKGTQRYIFKDYKEKFADMYNILQVDMLALSPNSKKERVIKLQREAKDIFQYLQEKYNA